ncbi:MAG: UDP-N-acetylmuramoyl-tripeptide--D-alanyl-D-alanine ligase [Candidatus Cloacimonadota bacterium]|nr:UDP-N-acetylmuramoyl-tripeptide--D-alanyl-D-alanine ligase [Candidatus Cloacimonadota bacterium]
MKKLTVKEIVEAINGKIMQDTQDDFIEYVQYDSRMITEKNENCLFFALNGEKVNGLNFVKQAFANGAKYAVVEEKPPNVHTSAGLIFVDNSLKAFGKLSRYYRDKFDIPFIGITGSVGKTTTKEFVANVLSEKFITHKSTGNLNTLIGLPYSILQMDKSSEISVIEMGTNHFGEIKKMAEMLNPSFAVITNVGESHVEFLENIEGVFHEKTDLFKYSSSETLKIFNGDNPLFEKYKHRAGFVSFGKNADNDFVIENIELKNGHFSFSLNKGEPESYRVRKVYSIFNNFKPNIYNSIPAIIIAKKLGLSDEQIKEGLMKVQDLDLRMEIKRNTKRDWLIIADCYNSNPMSLRSGIEHFVALQNSPKIAILGDMLELGAKSEEIHRQFGEDLKKSQIDRIITIGKYAEYFRGAAHYSDVTEALKREKFDFPQNSAILIKGSRDIKLEKILERITI